MQHPHEGTFCYKREQKITPHPHVGTRHAVSERAKRVKIDMPCPPPTPSGSHSHTKKATSIVMIEVALYFYVYVNYVNLYSKIDYKIRLVVVACALVV